MNKYTITSTIDTPDSESLISISISESGVKVKTDRGIAKLNWDSLLDVEYLADVFKYEYVIVFKEIVILLGNAYRLKEDNR